MCVILVCPPDVRPTDDVILACHAANPHGAGIAWRDKGEVQWLKNLDAEDVAELLPQLPGEVVIHFRWASVGGVNPRLCHPFPVDRTASTTLQGCARRVLFHNGTWRGYRDALSFIEKKRDEKVRGPISDTRVMALLVNHLNNFNVLKDVEGRFVMFTAKETRLFGPWREWHGMQCSNIGFQYELERVHRPKFKKAGSDQMILWGEGEGSAE